MKLLPLAAFILLISGCFNPKITSLKGSYLSSAYSIETETPINKVWDKLVDVFAQKGLSIKIIDRSSGLIVSERYGLTTTIENDKGELMNASAFIVMPKMWNPYTKKYEPAHGRTTGEWNVRVKEIDGKTVINVNIVNIQVYEPGVATGGSIVANTVECLACKSTGVFEKTVSDAIK